MFHTLWRYQRNSYRSTVQTQLDFLGTPESESLDSPSSVFSLLSFFFSFWLPLDLATYLVIILWHKFFPTHPLAILEDGWIMHRPLRHRSCANNVGMSSRRHPIPLSSDTMEDTGRCWLSAATAEILMSIEADFPPPSSHCQPFHPFSITWYGPPEPRASRQRRARGSGRSTTFSICHESRAAHYVGVLRVRRRERVQLCVGWHFS